ncbi:extracellular solute-binding protein [Paenibacillus alvei]|uniref:extracellular solute-binding protein n=1 Tax=Paenibacillus alvei TaxID=44250 RepID=UPI0018CEB389|nr:extracellular solute-binding protein [Paenibacillus alvei]MBG9733712.1 ABC transporter substrate-binding protein [Paenibacillus alvei]MBG9745745.1 ABC transporter substrate-binding protein [Paenibacillus alvei]MCY9580422.1 extracellular solute-binding protein [Paenibacillus alvei]MCY9583252.1 extracellular solute-binding protein [Paenibacillus alvei]
MKNKRKLLLSVLSVFMVFTMMVGCSSGGNTPQANEPAKQGEGTENSNSEASKSDVYELGKEPLEVTFFGNYGWYDMPKWGKDPASKWIQDNKKISVKAISSGGNAAQKLQTMIAGNELPDIIWTDRGADVERLREADMLVPLDEYIDKYPNFKKYLTKDHLGMLRSPDGKLYQLPNYYTTQPNGNAGYAINKRIYKDLGSPPLNTTDDLYNYLKAVKAKYPDVIPFETGLAKEGHGVDQIYSSFKEGNLTFTRFYGVPDGDKIESIYKDEPFRESALFVAKLMREKLMTQDANTQTEDQIKEKAMNGKFAVIAGPDPFKYISAADAELKKKDPDGGYEFIQPIAKAGLDRSKIYPGTYNQLGWNVALITKNAKNPEAIFAMLDWMTGPEASMVENWGPPGPDGYWNGFEADGVTPIFNKDKYLNDPGPLADINGVAGNLVWVGNTVYMDNTKKQMLSQLSPDQIDFNTRWQMEITWGTQADYTEFLNWEPLPDSKEGTIRQSVRDIWTTARAKAMYGKTDEEVLAILDKAHDDSMKLGLQELLDHVAKVWNENKKAMGR